ncbi:MAG: flagellar motor switch protein FliN [Candidatus Eisenbacteria bacterium]|nr:flagellar motor switch protein FliN [Candidatus Eisenbacteria bacterium]
MEQSPSESQAQAAWSQEQGAPDGAVAAGGGTEDGSAGLASLLDISIPVVIEIGRTEMTVQDLLQLSAGSVIPLERMVGEPVDVYVSDRKLAQGEVVVVGDRFGVRLTRLLGGAAPGCGTSAAA